jgi:hypothetical protein
MKTSWKGRNRALIEEAKREAERRGRKGLTLIDIAPGTVTRLMAPYFPRNEDLTTRILTPIDHTLRMTGQFSLHCYEVEEILEVFKPLEPAHLYVLYADPDVAKAVPENDLVLMNPTDISHDALLEIGDIVFCYNTISTTINPKKSLENLLHCVKIGGLLSIDAGTDWSLNPRTDPMFIGLSENLYLKEF